MPLTALITAAPGVPAQALVHLDGATDAARVVAIVIACAGLAALIRYRAGVGNGRDELIAAARATLQLSVVGLLIAAVLGSWWLTAAFVALMVGVASVTSSGRIRTVRRGWVFLPVAGGALPVTAGLLASGLLPLEPISLIPTAGILIGNAMTATTLAGRRGLDALAERRGEYEAGLAIGLPTAEAALLVCRSAVRLALVPGLDQTRTVGLVTLPGAFVGTLLGGATPLEAAALQLVVLVGILLTQSVAVAATLRLVVTGRLARP